MKNSIQRNLLAAWGIPLILCGISPVEAQTSSKAKASRDAETTEETTESAVPWFLSEETQAARLAFRSSLGIDTVWREVRDAEIAHAINPEDYACDSETAFRIWIRNEVGQVDPFTWFWLNNLAGLDLATYHTLLFDNDSSDDFIGINGEYSDELRQRHKDCQRFWDVRTDDILLMGMHGANVGDAAKMVPTVQVLFGVPEPVAHYITYVVQTLIQGGVVDMSLLGYPEPLQVPGIPDGFNNPLLTLNAFAFSDRGEEIIPGFGLIPDKIVMGEGILLAFEELGLEENAPDTIHAHEFAHHVQYELGLLDHAGHDPESTRRIELMADAFGAYNIAHARGATFQAKRFADTLSAAYTIGDCAFDNPGHHGTPKQREMAAVWGGSVVESATDQGHIYSATLMLELFDDELETILLPDAP